MTKTNPIFMTPSSWPAIIPESKRSPTQMLPPRAKLVVFKPPKRMQFSFLSILRQPMINHWCLPTNPCRHCNANMSSQEPPKSCGTHRRFHDHSTHPGSPRNATLLFSVDHWPGKFFRLDAKHRNIFFGWGLYQRILLFTSTTEEQTKERRVLQIFGIKIPQHGDKSFPGTMALMAPKNDQSSRKSPVLRPPRCFGLLYAQAGFCLGPGFQPYICRFPSCRFRVKILRSQLEMLRLQLSWHDVFLWSELQPAKVHCKVSQPPMFLQRVQFPCKTVCDTRELIFFPRWLGGSASW